jgi:hypothetical protein
LGFHMQYISCVYFTAFRGVRLKNVFIFCRHLASCGPASVVDIAIAYGPDGSGIESLWG